MEAGSTDWFVIFIAAALNMIIGSFWYSKWLFGPIWMKYYAIKESKNKKMAMLWAGSISVVIAFFLNFFAKHFGITSVSDGVFLGFCVWLGFVVTKQIDSVIWRKEPFEIFALNTGCDLLSFLVMGGIMGA